MTVSGQVNPVAKGVTIWIQQEQSAGSWATVKQVTTDAAGHYTGTFKVTAIGIRRYRAYIPAVTGQAGTGSPIRFVTFNRKPTVTFTTVQPLVSGSLRVGQRLTAKAGTWSPKPTKYTYQWRRDGSRIPGATTTSYLLTPADYRTYITVEVTAVRSGQVTGRESVTGTLVGSGLFVGGSAAIAGSRVGGNVLTATSTGWSPVPEMTTFEWLRNGQPIAGETSSTYRTRKQDIGADITVTATALRSSFTSRSVTSAAARITDPGGTFPVSPAPRFDDLMKPEASTVVPPSVATATFSSQPPDWFGRTTLVRWDTPGAFAHSLDPVAVGTLYSAANGGDFRRPEAGAEYHVNNSTLKNADVQFTVTGKRFAIRYWTVKNSDAMVWIDGKPVATQAFAGSDPTGAGRWNWITVTRTSTVPATIRIAGPMYFTGVDYDACQVVTVTAAPRFTLGVIGDSMFETLAGTEPMTSGPAPMLSTLTGFRVWNMAEGGTGYVNDGSGVAASGGVGYPGYLTSPFGSARRLASVTSAPIDALLVSGSINDVHFSPDAQRTALDKLLDDVAVARPGLPVVLVTLEPVSYPGVADQTDPRFRALNDSFDGVAERHPNVVGVIDPYAADWLTGTGSTAHPAGDGNQDQYVGADGVHLNAAGHTYYQGRIAAELRAMVARLAPANR
ncbi:hypothetical protein GCM10022234_09970 [Aeromicrobium panaciterrae]|uniref:GDSL-type esterase/lipase family protein n=1 Tax=Aeromicrobium panaciterrae TaxID=363861 RepID=UPI0031DFAC54